MHVFIVTAGYDHTIRFWEAPSGRCYRTLQYPDSVCAHARAPPRAQSWGSRRAARRPAAHNPVQQVNQLAISPDKRFIAAAGNPHVRLFDANSTNPNPVTSWEGHTSSVTAVGFQKDGKWIYTGSEDGTVKIWDMRCATRRGGARAAARAGSGEGRGRSCAAAAWGGRAQPLRCPLRAVQDTWLPARL